MILVVDRVKIKQDFPSGLRIQNATVQISLQSETEKKGSSRKNRNHLTVKKCFLDKLLKSQLKIVEC